MKSSSINKSWKRLSILALIGAMTVSQVSAVTLEHKATGRAEHKLEAAGIFSRMIDQVTASERRAQERHEATKRKQEQLAQAEAEYQKSVAEEEAEEAAKKKKEEEEAEQAALDAAKNSPAARLSAATNEAASAINMNELEASIQAQLQAKMQAGASKEELLAQASIDEVTASVPAIPNVAAPAATNSVVAQVLAKHGVAAKKAAPAKPKAAPQKLAAAQPATDDTKASMDKVKEMAQKLGVPFTSDLMALGSNSAISDALIEKAVAAGKTEAEINAAMAAL